jgi:hypothetical protein
VAIAIHVPDWTAACNIVNALVTAAEVELDRSDPALAAEYRSLADQVNDGLERAVPTLRAKQ